MIRYATKHDVPRIHQLIKDLAEYEKAPLEAKATIEQIEETFFGENPVAYCRWRVARLAQAKIWRFARHADAPK